MLAVPEGGEARIQRSEFGGFPQSGPHGVYEFLISFYPYYWRPGDADSDDQAFAVSSDRLTAISRSIAVQRSAPVSSGFRARFIRAGGSRIAPVSSGIRPRFIVENPRPTGRYGPLVHILPGYRSR